MDYSKQQVNDLIDGIYSGEITEYDIPEPLYFAIANELKQALYTGFGGNLSDFSGTDYALLSELRENIYMFSAAKSYTELKDMRSLLIDNPLFPDFKKAAQAKYNIYNVDYLKSEFNTAQASGDMAIKWADIERNKEILPMLQYQTAGGDVCPICKPLDKVTLPATDKFWKERYPPNHFNCMCVVTQHEDDEFPKTKDIPDTLPIMSDVFKMNVGVDKYVYSPEHPYFQVEPKDREYAKNNFNLPIPPPEPPAKFQKAKTLKEAENRIMQNGVKSVSLKGMNEGQFNAVLEAVEEEYQASGLNIEEIITFNSKTKSVRAQYAPNNNKIGINLAKINQYKYKKPEKFTELKDKIEVAIKDLKENYLGSNKYSQKSVLKELRRLNENLENVNNKIADGQEEKSWSVSSMFEDSNTALKSTIHHEIGHNKHFKVIGEGKFRNYSKQESISDYGESNHFEYFAEWYSYYRMFGSKGVPENVLTEIEKLK
jgi:hypothetical protein